MYIEDIRRRQMYLNMGNIYSKYPTSVLIENCNKSTSMINITEYFKSWCTDNSNNQYEFVEVCNVLESYVKRSNKSDSNKAIRMFCETVLPKATNMKIARNVIKSLDIDTKAIVEKCDNYIIADRIYNNHNRLINRGIGSILENVITTTEEGVDEYITKVCEFVDNINMNFPVKYNVALENTLYLLHKSYIDHNKKKVLESVNDYFLININEENFNIMKTILSESTLYDKSDKYKYLQEKVNFDIEEDDEDLDVILGQKEIKESSNVKDFMQTIKELPDKNINVIKSILAKAYTKSPDQVINGLPNFFIWIRKFLIFSTVSVTPFITIPLFMIDYMIENKIQKSEAKKVISSYKKEIEKTEKQISNTDNEKRKDKLEQYLKKLKDGLSELEDYEDNLYNGDDERDVNENSNIKLYDYITKDEYMSIHHPNVILRMNSLKNNIQRAIGSKYDKVFSDNIIFKNLSKFNNCDASNIQYFINNNGKVCNSFAKVIKYHTDEKSFKKLHEDICSKLNDDYNIITRHGENECEIFIEFNKPILVDSIKENVHIGLLEDAATIIALEEQVSKLSNSDIGYLLSYVDEHIDEIDMATVKCIGQFSVVASDLIPPTVVSDLLAVLSDDARILDGTSKYIKLAKINEGYVGMKEYSERDTSYISPYNVYDDNKLLIESLDLLTELIINETSFVNTMKLAQKKLRANMDKLSDKEKKISKELDYSVDSLVSKLQRTATNNNREAIIKGSIIPSASKTIKSAIAAGVAWAVNPAIAVIGVLGGLATSKHANNKERQYILDEINIELKLVEKKIDLAEKDDDTKQMGELLRLQQKLKKEKSRIEFKKKDYIPKTKED